MTAEHFKLRQYLLSGSLWAFAGRAGTALMGLILSALLARILSPPEMGAYFLAFSLTAFFAIFARLGLENTILRHVSESMGKNDPGRAYQVITKGFRIGVSGCVVISSLYLLSGRWIALTFFSSKLLADSTVWIAAWIALLSLQFLLAETFRAFRTIKAASLFGGLLSWTGAVLLTSILWLAHGHSNLSSALTMVVSGFSLNLVVGFYFLGKRSFGLRTKPIEKIHDKELIYDSLPLLVNALTMFMITRSDLWILGAFRPEQEVAVYGAAARLVLLTGMALAVVNSVVPPLIGSMSVLEKKKTLEQILRGVATVAALPALCILVFFILFSSPVLGLIFGKYYGEGSLVLIILSLGQAVNVMVGSCGYVLIMTGHQTTLMRITFFSAILAVTSGMCLVQILGKEGVALGFMLATICQQLLMLLMARRCSGIWTHSNLLKVRESFRILTRMEEIR